MADPKVTGGPAMIDLTIAHCDGEESRSLLSRMTLQEADELATHIKGVVKLAREIAPHLTTSPADTDTSPPTSSPPG